MLGRRAHGPLWQLAFLSRAIVDSEDLIHYCCRLGDYPEETAAKEKRGAIREAALQIRRMHDIGIHHGDLHLKNLLLRRKAAGTPEVYVIDFDRASIGPPLDVDQRLGNLKRLARSVRKTRVADAVLSDRDRLRFLHVYLRGVPDSRRLLREWARKLATAGKGHGIWWYFVGARRDMRGDRIGRRSSLRLGPRR